jgi:hypothetical protein
MVQNHAHRKIAIYANLIFPLFFKPVYPKQMLKTLFLINCLKKLSLEFSAFFENICEMCVILIDIKLWYYMNR